MQPDPFRARLRCRLDLPDASVGDEVRVGASDIRAAGERRIKDGASPVP